jgi:hypothetical protein
MKSVSWPPSSVLLVLFGATLIAMGAYFVFIRPPLLPEDLRFIGLSSSQVGATMPGLPGWLTHVFRVMGGHIAAAGVLTITLALTSFREHQWSAAIGVLVAGAASIGWMVIVNFMINSDYKWLLLAMSALWACSLALFWFERGKGNDAAPRRS